MRYRDNFLLLRLVTALLVMYGHSFPITGHAKGLLLGIPAGYLRVVAFFAISGYLVGQSWIRDPDYIRFFQRRAVRIVPAFAVCIALTLIVFGPLLTTEPMDVYFSADQFHVYLKNLAFYITYSLPGVFTDNIYPKAVNGSIWTIPVEISLYLLIPFIFLFLRAGVVGIVILAAASGAAIVYRTGYMTADPIFYAVSLSSWLTVAPYFVSGVVYAHLLRSRKIPLLLGIVAIISLSTVWISELSFAVHMLIAVPVAWISIGQSREIFPALRTRIGDLSYGVFLYGFIIQQALVQYSIFPTSPIMNFLISSPIAILFGWCSWHYIESPMKIFNPKVAPSKRINEVLV